MKVILDGQEIPFVEDLSEKIEGRLKQKNLVISSLLVNGAEMVNTSLAEVLAEPAEGKVVEIETCPAGELLQESMADAREYLPRLMEGLPQIREKLMEGNLQAVHAMIDSALEGLEWLGLTFQAYLSQGDYPEAERVFTVEYSRLGTVMQEMEAALRTNRMEAACDIFEQQVIPFLEKLSAMVEEF